MTLWKMSSGNNKQVSYLNAPVQNSSSHSDISLKCGEYRVPLSIIFVDFTKAFSSVYRPSLWKILKSYGIPGKVVSAIEQIYNSKC